MNQTENCSIYVKIAAHAPLKVRHACLHLYILKCLIHDF